MQKYWTFKEEISDASGLMFKNAKLIVPIQMRQEILNKIHESHLGIVKCKDRKRDILYWPGMSAQIEDNLSQCAVCNENKNSNPKEPLLPHTVPGRPWEKLRTDLLCGMPAVNSELFQRAGNFNMSLPVQDILSPIGKQRALYKLSRTYSKRAQSSNGDPYIALLEYSNAPIC